MHATTNIFSLSFVVVDDDDYYYLDSVVYSAIRSTCSAILEQMVPARRLAFDVLVAIVIAIVCTSLSQIPSLLNLLVVILRVRVSIFYLLFETLATRKIIIMAMIMMMIISDTVLSNRLLRSLVH